MDRRKKLAYDRIKESRANQLASKGPRPVTGFSWSLPFRLKGLALGMALSDAYSYLIMHGWYLSLIIPATILGYFIGWAIGYWLFNKRMK